MPEMTIDAQKLLDRIRAGEKERSAVITQLVNDRILKEKIESYIKKNQGDTNDGTTIFHDAIVTLVKTAFNKKDYVISSHPHAYLLGVAKNLWMNELRKRAKRETSPIEYADQETSEEDGLALTMKGDRSRIISAVLGQIARNCKEVLMLWAGGYQMREIAEKLNYNSEGMARKKKSNCMKELYKYLDNNPHIVERIRPI